MICSTRTRHGFPLAKTDLLPAGQMNPATARLASNSTAPYTSSRSPRSAAIPGTPLCGQAVRSLDTGLDAAGSVEAMWCLVTGATGYVGGRLAPRLLAAG